MALVAVGVSLIASSAYAQQPATPRPAPTEDRVGFPQGYQTRFKPMFVLDRPDNKQIRVVYANDQAAAARPGEPFPYGSILVMETYRAAEDEAGDPVLTASGRFERDALTGVFVMRKERGFGAAYEMNRTGEWEYVAFRPDGSYQATPQQSAACAVCHTEAGGTRDWVFRTNLFFGQGDGSLPRAEGLATRLPMQQYTFQPVTVRVRPGTTITWVNEDEAIHTVTAADQSFDSGQVLLGETFTMTFTEPGTFDYVCTLHAGMKGVVLVQ
jgi:plastocyanin